MLEPLQAAAQAHGSARIMNLTAPSTVPLSFDDLQAEKKFSSLNALGAIKMANLLFTFELARRLESTGIAVNAIHPGLARSGLMLEALFLMRLLTRLNSPPPEKVTGPPVKAATAYALDRDAQQRLWEISESLMQLDLTEGVTPINDPHLE